MKWWQWWLIAAGCGAVAIISPIADQHGHGSFAILVFSLAALVAGSVCFVVGVTRLMKCVWSKAK